VGLGASAVLHLLAVLLYPLLVQRSGLPTGPPLPAIAPAPQGIQVVRIREVADAAEPAGPEPRPAPEPTPTRPPAEPGADAPPDTPRTPAPAADPATPPGLSAAERLRPRVTDPRLWSLDPDRAALSREQIAQLELLWSVLALNDSAAAEAARSRALTDWTFTDADGKRWGVADGKIYLGDLAIPFPFAFGGPLIPGSPAAQRSWMDAEIDRAWGAAAARANMDERIRAIRQRLDRERERRRQQTDSTGARPGGG
jgi:hypothetical protein